MKKAVFGYAHKTYSKAGQLSTIKKCNCPAGLCLEKILVMTHMCGRLQ
jgi:hypothetical protein